jgi:hypothetical protein
MQTIQHVNTKLYCIVFWSSAETINIINYFFRNLNCILWLLCYAQYLILETVVLTFVFCIVSFHLCVMFSLSLSLTSFISDCYMTEFVDQRNDMYVCMYLLMIPESISGNTAIGYRTCPKHI